MAEGQQEDSEERLTACVDSIDGPSLVLLPCSLRNLQGFGAAAVSARAWAR